MVPGANIINKEFTMKNTLKVFGIIALATVIGFSMAACGGDDGDDLQSVTYTGTAGGQSYTLRISENPARYAAQREDNYVLISGSKSSMGKVADVSGDELTLQPSKTETTFKANVSESGLTALLGTITWSDGSQTTAPGTVTAQGSSGTGSGTGGGGGGGGTGGVATLNLSGQVYTEDQDFDMGSMTMKTVRNPYTGPNKSFSSNVGETGSITNGKMSFSVGTPPTSSLEPFNKNDLRTSEYDIYRDAKITPSDTKGVGLEFTIDLDRINITTNFSSSSVSSTVESVSYIYYDKDCTVTATGGTITAQGITMTFPNLNLTYKKGWNTYYQKVTSTTSYTSQSGTATIVINQTAPDSCVWVLDD